MRKLARRAGIVLWLLVSLLVQPTARAQEPSDLLLILDASGSMWGKIEKENKIVIARRALGSLIDELPEGGDVGLIAYGHRREGDCADIETLAPLAPLNAQAKARLKSLVEGLNPKGKTPITASLEMAIQQVRQRDGATVILLSDGLETCGGDPCATVRAAREAGVELVLHVIGFDVEGEDISQLECAAQAGGGLFLSAEDADQLASALDAAVALPVEAPAGRLSVQAVTDGKLQDASVLVTRAGADDQVAVGRTYTHPETNPRLLPLADGKYDVKVQAVGLRGDVVRRFEGVEIRDGGLVEKRVDFSSGELAVGAKRNGALSDASVQVRVSGQKEQVAGGRTYRAAANNPKVMELTAGTYDVEVRSVEIAGHEAEVFSKVEIEPGKRTELNVELVSGDLAVGAVRGGQLVDATVQVFRGNSKDEVDRGRTYTAPKTNPLRFVLEPGNYRVEVSEVRGEGKASFTVELKAGDEVERIAELK